MHEFSIAKGIIETALAETEKQRLRLNLSTLLSNARNAAINLTFTKVNRIARSARARS